ncbi:MAG: bifunctional lysine-specific demethylase and histidyl-hydroxylase [Sphingomonadales bacterium]|jgi:ribosomal protein L16 Arg81 hydroxylase|nr:bifunctional lysine-specific demethylase and histidyl-hydroxylase [Sphingomonadales bacterium]
MSGVAIKKTGSKAAAAGPSPSWEEDALGFLIAPVRPQDFLGRYYEREALVNVRSEPDRYADLLTLEILDHFVNSADLREGMIDLTSQKNRISRDDYIDEQGRVSRVAVAEEYLDGATIILPQFHDSIFKLGEFCRALEEVFSCHVQTNIYLTPSGNQGFPIHYDNHDVFVMQVSGAKAWRLYGVPVETPFRGEQFQLGQHEPGPVSQEFTLNPGDCVYVPRGMMHDAENVGEEPSLHITVGLITKTWADLLLESVSELALTSPDFRRSLPAGFAGRDFDREAARTLFDKLKREIADHASMDSAFDLLADNFVRGRRPNVSGVISAAVAGPQEGDRYRRRRFVPWNVADDEGKLVLIGPGGDLSFEADEGDALDVALSGAPFTAADLACEDPAELIKTLWSGGYLERLS